MPQQSIELILFRQLADYLATPIFIVDSEGSLQFCNEPAEKILEFQFSKIGELSAKEWANIFLPQDLNGNPIPRVELPLYISITQFKPAHAKFYIRGLQTKMPKYIEVFTFPIIKQMDIFLGGLAIFREVEEFEI